MTKKHAPSFLFSVIVHLLVGFIFYSTYQAVVSITKPKKKETLMCVSLSTYVPQEIKKEVVKEKIIKKKIIKKVVQKMSKKPPKKKITHKKIKKVLPQKVFKKIAPQKTLQKEKPQKEKPQKEKFQKEIIQEVSQAPSPLETPKKEELVVVKECNTTIQTPQISLQKEYVDNHLEKIATLLHDNLYYPRRARKRGIVGVVMVHFLINKDATVSQLQVISSSSEILSRAAIKTIEDLSGKFPKPKEKLFLKIPIKYALTY